MTNYERYKKYLNGLTLSQELFNFKDKERNVIESMQYMFNRTQRIFKWENLPDTIPQRILELYLQFNGNVCWYKHEGKLYVFTGGLGGEPDVYYRPTIYTIANPALNLTVQARINEDCIVMHNDSMSIGLIPMFSKYASMLSELELTINRIAINARAPRLISARDESTRKSAQQFVDDLENGELDVVAEKTFIEGLQTQEVYSTSGRQLTELRELYQYYRSMWYNDIGLSQNVDVKRAHLLQAEVTQNDVSLLPVTDDMLARRMEGIEKVNQMFGTNIKVTLASAWDLIHVETHDNSASVWDETQEATQPDMDTTEESPDTAEDTPEESDVEDVEEEVPEESNDTPIESTEPSDIPEEQDGETPDDTPEESDVPDDTGDTTVNLELDGVNIELSVEREVDDDTTDT